MTRPLLVGALLAWLGVTLLLSCSRRLARPTLAERLAPYAPLTTTVTGGAAPSPSDLRALLESGGGHLARAFGVDETAQIRLRRIHSPLDATTFRVRQAAWAATGFAAGLAITALGAPAPVALLTLVGGPLLGFLAFENHLVKASQRWQQQLRRETPIVAEQLAMLLNAGYSLAGALERIARRANGCCATDLATVTNRIRQGVPERTALQEWADTASVEPVTRLVSVLSADTEGTDRGRQLTNEAHHARRALHRETVELLERRAEQVWIPVSVATLIPGVILLAVPFLAALRLFANA